MFVQFLVRNDERDLIIANTFVFFIAFRRFFWDIFGFLIANDLIYSLNIQGAIGKNNNN